MGHKKGYNKRKRHRQQERKWRDEGYFDGVSGIYEPPPENASQRNKYAYTEGLNKAENKEVWN